MFCDLDDFKTVNDQLGHEAGDAVLRETALRLRHCVRAEDTVARLGGDEFAVVCQASEEPPRSVGRRIVAVMDRPFLVSGERRTVRASVGLVVLDPDRPSPPGPASPSSLLRQADLAMYQAKRLGKGAMVVDGDSD